MSDRGKDDLLPHPVEIDEKFLENLDVLYSRFCSRHTDLEWHENGIEVGVGDLWKTGRDHAALWVENRVVAENVHEPDALALLKMLEVLPALVQAARRSRIVATLFPDDVLKDVLYGPPRPHLRTDSIAHVLEAGIALRGGVWRVASHDDGGVVFHPEGQKDAISIARVAELPSRAAAIVRVLNSALRIATEGMYVQLEMHAQQVDVEAVVADHLAKVRALEAQIEAEKEGARLMCECAQAAQEVADESQATSEKLREELALFRRERDAVDAEVAHLRKSVAALSEIPEPTAGRRPPYGDTSGRLDLRSARAHLAMTEHAGHLPLDEQDSLWVELRLALEEVEAVRALAPRLSAIEPAEHDRAEFRRILQRLADEET